MLILINVNASPGNRNPYQGLSTLYFTYSVSCEHDFFFSTSSARLLAVIKRFLGRGDSHASMDPRGPLEVVAVLLSSAIIKC
jgi:hypothetical protein